MAYGQGRPRRVAVLDWSTGVLDSYTERFYGACRTLSYSDCVALSNALRISLREVYNYRTLKCVPYSVDTILTVLAWVDSGKPTKLVGQHEYWGR